MTKDEMKNKISLALKDPILQQGFEIICKENTELKKDKQNLRADLRTARNNLQAKDTAYQLAMEELDYAKSHCLFHSDCPTQKENAELKADNDARKFAMAMSEKVEKQLREEIAELKEKLNFSTQYYQGEKAKEQLTKAKEIIKNLIDYPKRFGQASGKYHHECELAEQFLKDSKQEGVSYEFTE